MVASGFKLFPNLIAILSRYVSDGFPIVLDFLHYRCYSVKLITILIFLCNFYKFKLLLKVAVLFLFLIFIEAVFLMIKVSCSFFESLPNLFVVVLWNATGVKKLVSKALNFFNSILPAFMTWFGFLCNFRYIFNKRLFLFVVSLKNFFKFSKLFLTLVVNYFCSITEFIPNFISIFFSHWPDIFLPHFVKHLKFTESFIYICFLCEFFSASN